VFIAVAGFVLAHKNTLFMPFLSDDYMFVAMTQPSSLYKVIRSALPENCDILYYRPVAFLSLSIDSFLWKTNPFGFHLTNLLLHAGNVFLVYLLALRLIRKHGGAVMAAACFLVFPLQHEVTLWICGRFDSLAVFFYLLCALSYIQYRTSGLRRWFFGSLLFGLLSLLSKEIGITFPVLLLGMERILFFDEPFPRKKQNLLCLSVLLLIIPLYIGFRWVFLQDAVGIHLDAMPADPAGLSPARILLMSVFGTLMSVFTVPWRLIICPFNPLYQTSAWHFWVSHLYQVVCLLLILAGISTGAVRNRVTLFCLFFFFISLLPAGMMFFSLAPGNLQNARLLYLAVVFLAILFGNLAFGGHQPGFRFLRPAVRYGLVVALVILLGVGLVQNNRNWVDAGRLSERILARFGEYARQLDQPSVIYAENIPISHQGVYIFGTGFMEAVNLSMGTLPEYQLKPDGKKLSSYARYLLAVLPWKPMIPNFLEQRFLHAELTCQGFTYPDWYSLHPGDYDHVIRWNPQGEFFEVIR